jgi:hypothetical protein
MDVVTIVSDDRTAFMLTIGSGSGPAQLERQHYHHQNNKQTSHTQSFFKTKIQSFIVTENAEQTLTAVQLSAIS